MPLNHHPFQLLSWGRRVSCNCGEIGYWEELWGWPGEAGTGARGISSNSVTLSIRSFPDQGLAQVAFSYDDATAFWMLNKFILNRYDRRQVCFNLCLFFINATHFYGHRRILNSVPPSSIDLFLGKEPPSRHLSKDTDSAPVSLQWTLSHYEIPYKLRFMWRSTTKWVISNESHLKGPWRWGRLKAGEEGDDRGWDGWMASLTQRTWVWVSSRSWWWTGRPDGLQSMGVTKSWTRLSDWTEVKNHQNPKSTGWHNRV